LHKTSYLLFFSSSSTLPLSSLQAPLIWRNTLFMSLISNQKQSIAPAIRNVFKVTIKPPISYLPAPNHYRYNRRYHAQPNRTGTPDQAFKAIQVGVHHVELFAYFRPVVFHFLTSFISLQTPIAIRTAKIIALASMVTSKVNSMTKTSAGFGIRSTFPGRT
jgi:hypothetical protein